MADHIKIGFRVGGLGFLIAMFLMFVLMGLPLGNILLAIPVGIFTGRRLVKVARPNTPIPKKFSVGASFTSGTLTAIGTVVPLLVLAKMAPPGATIGNEFSKWINPNVIPASLNSMQTALAVGAVFSALVVLGLTIESCTLTIRKYNEKSV